ncbi:MAG: RNase P subunit p30 family protein [Candidatus Helarchaeota archaeon]
MKYYDLGIYSSLSDGQDEPEIMIEMAIELGFAGIGLADFTNHTPKIIKGFRNKYKERCPIFTRATLAPKTTDEMKKWVKNLRNQVDIIAIKSGIEDKTIYVNAIVDKRIDIISLSEIADFESLEYVHFKMARNNGKLIEIVVRNLILQSGVQRSKLLRQMIKTCTQIIRSKVPFLISSGAQSKWEMRAPRELVALASLVKIPEKIAFEAVSTHAEKLIQKIHMIRDPNYIMAGVRIVSPTEEGENGD